MAFAVHVKMGRCTERSRSVVACPVDAPELSPVQPATVEKVYIVKDGKTFILDFKSELCTGCGVCIEKCPCNVIHLEGRVSLPPVAAV